MPLSDRKLHGTLKAFYSTRQIMNADDIRYIKNLLVRMQKADTEFRVYGTELHKYRLGPTLSESELAAFEAKYGIVLPADYRFFLNECGNGADFRSTAPYIAINSGPGPGNGLLPLHEAAIECDPSKPFPLTESTETSPVAEADLWGDECPYPGVLEISYGGCAFYTFLVVNGPAYGTIWDADGGSSNFYPTGLSFQSWYHQWVERLKNRALPILANEQRVAHISVGMTKSQLVDICGTQFKQMKFGEQHTCLRFDCLTTQFQLDESEVVVRIIRHCI